MQHRALVGGSAFIARSATMHKRVDVAPSFFVSPLLGPPQTAAIFSMRNCLRTRKCDGSPASSIVARMILDQRERRARTPRG